MGRSGRCRGSPLWGEQFGREAWRTASFPWELTDDSPSSSAKLFNWPVSLSTWCFPLTWTKVQKTFTLVFPGLIPLFQLCDELWFGKGNSYSQGKKPRGPWVSSLKGYHRTQSAGECNNAEGSREAQSGDKVSLNAEKKWLKGGGNPEAIGTMLILRCA